MTAGTTSDGGRHSAPTTVPRYYPWAPIAVTGDTWFVCDAWNGDAIVSGPLSRHEALAESRRREAIDGSWS